MDFPFTVSRVLPDSITIINGSKRYTVSGNEKEIQSIIDKLGSASAMAQGLKAPITTYSKLVQNKDQNLYILQENDCVVGFIKTGERRLFLWDHLGLIHEVVPLCVLDFYVHESQQRKGYGKYLFEQVLQTEQLQPCEVAIDRPSIKFLKFLQKHYNLHSYIKQNNNYVVFKDFFTTCVHYDHAHKSSNKRLSLPNKPVISPVQLSSNKRLSLSPKMRWTTNITYDADRSLPLSGNSSFHSIPSKTSILSDQDKATCQTGNIPLVNQDQISWSNPVKPVPTLGHAPFLTLRGQPRQRSLHSIFEGDGSHSNNGQNFRGRHNVSFNNRDTSMDSRYSKYDLGTTSEPTSQMRSAHHKPSPYHSNSTLQQLKKQSWRSHLH